MAKKTIERVTCDYETCGAKDETGGDGWVVVQLLKPGNVYGDKAEEKHICPIHDLESFEKVLVQSKADPARIQRKHKL